MSSWNIGLGDVSKQTQGLKDQLSSKDTLCASLQSQLMRREAELDEIKLTLNETLHKLSREADRALNLERDLHRCSDDLRNEKIGSQNREAVLTAANEKVKRVELESRELEVALQSLSHNSDSAATSYSKLNQEKSKLEARVRELEVNLQRLSAHPPPTHPPSRISKPRSSSMSNSRVSTLEVELSDLRSASLEKESELRNAHEKLSRIQHELIKVENERTAAEKSLRSQMQELQSSLEDKQEEVEMLKALQGDDNTRAREEELLKRIEEDDARIMALEMVLADNGEIRSLKTTLAVTEQKLKVEIAQHLEGQERNIELIREKEEALDRLDEANEEIEKLRSTSGELRSEIQDKESRLTSVEVSLSEALARVHDLELSNHSHPSRSTADNVVASNVQQLLEAVERLRGERDGLRRDLEFLETETKFTAEAQRSNGTQKQESTEIVDALKAEIDQVQRMLAQERNLGERRQQQLKRSNLTSIALAVVVAHARSQVSKSSSQLCRISTELSDAQSQMETYRSKDEELNDVRLRLTEAEAKLFATAEQLAASEASMQVRQHDWSCEAEDLKGAKEEAQGAFDEVKTELAHVTKTLEDVESQRNSLAVQNANLQADLDSAQQDLIDAENRYSNLQAQQFSVMSTTDATRALREQIEALEMRVLRRTEQIGVHQHDIGRLETNLRLQEERVGEMTTELETLAAEKEAMVEDCADAREARDEALRRVESLELELEALEGKFNDLEQERTSELSTMVGVVMDTVARSRVAIQRTESITVQSQSSEAQMKQSVLHSQQEKEDALRDVDRLQCDNSKLIEELEYKASSLQSLSTSMEVIEGDLRQATVAIAALHASLRDKVRLVKHMEGDRSALDHQLHDLQQDLDAKLSQVHSLEDQLDKLRMQYVKDSAAVDMAFDSQKADLEEKIEFLQRVNDEADNRHRDTLADMTRMNNELRNRLDKVESLLASNDREAELGDLRSRHANEVASLELRLETITRELEQEKDRYATAKAHHELSLEEADCLRRNLEDRLAIALERAAASEQLEHEMVQMRTEHLKETSQLQEHILEVEADLEALGRSKSDLETLHSEAAKKLLTARQNFERELLQASQQSLAATRQVESDMADLVSRHDRKVDELQAQVGHSTDEIARLQVQLKEVIENRAREQEEYRSSLKSESERLQQAESIQAGLHNELTDTRGQLEKTSSLLSSMESEKTSLQMENTSLEAEIQRSLSLTRFLESQVKECESSISKQKENLERIRADLSRSEQSGKAAEVQLSLERAQHEKTIASLRREIAALKSIPSLEDVVAELREKNEEMDELLRKKCAEIEENDDRFIELLKEKKKLTTKVDSLSRKVLNLQAKLAAAKEAAPSAKSEPPLPNQNRLFASTKSPPVPPTPSLAAAVPVSRVAPSRIVSGPSSVARPSTPESRKTSQSSVFRAKTPERRIEPAAIMSDAGTPTAGKKRRHPDDFDSGDNIPAQGFNMESRPTEDATPRLRRVLNSVHSGFTPVRKSTRPIPAKASPGRRVTTGAPVSMSLIADVTNSPRAVSQASRPAKRGWLGKVRGAGALSTPSGTNVFERMPRS